MSSPTRSEPGASGHASSRQIVGYVTAVKSTDAPVERLFLHAVECTYVLQLPAAAPSLARFVRNWSQPEPPLGPRCVLAVTGRVLGEDELPTLRAQRAEFLGSRRSASDSGD